MSVIAAGFRDRGGYCDAAAAATVVQSGDNAENASDGLRLRVEEQREQIRMLTEQNASILEEVERKMGMQPGDLRRRSR